MIYRWMMKDVYDSDYDDERCVCLRWINDDGQTRIIQIKIPQVILL